MISSISSSMNSYAASSLKEMQQRMFQKADTDGDGQISKSELSTMAANGSKDGPSSHEMLAKLDTDGDGVVSREESDAAIESMQSKRPPGPPPEAFEAGDSTTRDSSDSLTETLLDALKSQEESSATSKPRESDWNQLIQAALRNYRQASLSNSSQDAESASTLGSQLYA